MPSRQVLALSTGDPGGEFTLLGDPGIWGSLGRALGSFAPGGALAPTAGQLGRIRGRASSVIRQHPVATGAGIGAVGAAAAIGLGGVIAGGSVNGFIPIHSKKGRLIKLVAPSGRVVNLVRRRRGISAAALSGAFRLARIAHQFGSAARTGHRPRRRARA